MRRAEAQRLATTLAAMLMLTACHSVAVPRPGSAFTPRNRGVSVVAPNRLGVVDVFAAQEFKAESDAILIDARPKELPPQVELLAVRVGFLYGVQHVYLNATAGNFCTDTWPPLGFGPTYSVNNLQLRKSEILSITFYVRAKEPGDWVAKGVHLTYRIGSQPFFQNDNAMTFTIQRRLAVKDLPRQPTCDPKLRYPWVMPSDAPSKLLVVRTPTPE